MNATDINNVNKYISSSNFDFTCEFNKYRVGAWNANGWKSVTHPENTTFKENVLKSLDLDFYLLSETHCFKNELLHINGFKNFQYNRAKVSDRAIKGSGGVAIALNNRLLTNHIIVAEYKGTYDGLLALKLRNIDSDSLIGIVVNYLPPDSFHYGRDPEGYFADNSVIWSDLLDCDLVLGGGDLNSRTKSELDYLPEIDGKLISPRSNPDTVKNNHGEYFLQFLKDNRALICNGRVTPELNGFTFLSVRGRSVPDYIYCPADHIQYCKSLKVMKVSEIIDLYKLPPPSSLPDHSLLIGDFDISTNEEFISVTNSAIQQNQKLPNNATYIKGKKNVKKIDSNFFMSADIARQVNDTILKIEMMNVNQNTLNEIYGEIKGIFMDEMSKLPNLPTSTCKKSKRKIRKSHEFWNQELDHLWVVRCEREKLYSNFVSKSRSNNVQRKTLQSEFQEAQKHFDKKFRFFKRQHKSNKNKNLANNAKNDPKEMWKQINALSEPKSSKVILEIIRQDKSITTDIKEILERWHTDISGLFSGLRENPEMAYDDDFFKEICDLKNDFENLSNEQQEQFSEFDSSSINNEISLTEVSVAINKTKSGKSFLDIPNEALKNQTAKKLLHKFFNICFKNGLSPFDWDQSDIKPIPKKDKDPRDPLNNRCITIMCCIAKIYSSILNARLQIFLDKNQILVDEQNGFRSSRSCIDHIFALVTVLRNRKSLGKSTFLSFIDFKKAFDSVDRTLLLHKLSKIGIVGKIYNAIASLFRNPKSRVILNNIATDWFNCPIGVKQGDIISPTLFAIYINDLAEELRVSGIGIDIGNELKLNCLLYADDIVLLAESEIELQNLLNIVNSWCAKWRLEVNLLKTNIMHIRKKQCPQSEFEFRFEDKIVDYCSNYRYLGITVNQHLSFEKSTEDLCDSANRSLSGIITKMIKNGGFPLIVYRTLYDSCVCSITDYGSEVFGFHEYKSREMIHNRAIRMFLGVSKTAPTAGVRAELNWLEPRSRTQTKMVRMLHRLVNMPDSRITKKIFLWDAKLAADSKLTTWVTEVNEVLDRNNLRDIFKNNIFDLKSTVERLNSSLFKKDHQKLKTQCSSKPKLRTYNLISDFPLENPFLLKPLTFIQRKFLSKIRLGVLQLRIETGRYERPKKPADERICKQCSMAEVEDEAHFLLKCPRHSLLRSTLLEKIYDPNFEMLNVTEKLKFLLNNPSIVKQTAQFVIDAYDNRSTD